MIHYLTYTDDGVINGCNSIQPEHSEKTLSVVKNAVLLDKPLENIFDFYWNGFSVVKKPPKPNNYCVFDYKKKEWVDSRSFEEIKESQWQIIKAKREEAENGGFLCDGVPYDSDPISQSRIQGAVQLALIAVSTQQMFVIEWTTQNNQVKKLDAAEMLKVGAALAEHIGSCHAKSRNLRERINQATDLNELERIVW